MDAHALQEKKQKINLGGHETFAFRNGWLKKGIDAICEDGFVFTHDEALVTLGVGKNMVRSIRHWCLATDLAQERNGPGVAKPLVPTELGKRLLSPNGWDPYLEDMGSLWLMHWQLVSGTIRSLAWSTIFSAYYDAEFSKKQLIGLLSRQLEQLGIHTTSGSIEREVDCLLHTYVSTSNSKNSVSEENFDCPLVELDLIQPIPEENLFRFNIGAKPSLPTAVFGYALFHFLTPRLQTRRTVAVEEILYQAGSPGMAFKLDENSLVEHIEILEQKTAGGMRMNETAGLRQIYLTDDIALGFTEWSFRLLDQYYGHDKN